MRHAAAAVYGHGGNELRRLTRTALLWINPHILNPGLAAIVGEEQGPEFI
jgi:hypothetical protein